jgi:hypothetical protein
MGVDRQVRGWERNRHPGAEKYNSADCSILTTSLNSSFLILCLILRYDIFHMPKEGHRSAQFDSARPGSKRFAFARAVRMMLALGRRRSDLAPQKVLVPNHEPAIREHGMAIVYKLLFKTKS